MQRSITLIALLLLAVGQLFTQIGKVTPVDDSSRDPSLSAFRRQIIAALATNDTAFLWRAIDSNAYNELAGIRGLSDVKQYYRRSRRSVAREWSKPLELGGTLSTDGTTYRAPYTNVRLPGDVDPHDYVIITGSRVNVRMAPSPASPVIRQLTYDIVKQSGYQLHRDSLGGTWIEVELADSVKGFVSERYAASPIGCRVTLTKRHNIWRLSSWSCGD